MAWILFFPPTHSCLQQTTLILLGRKLLLGGKESASFILINLNPLSEWKPKI